MTTLTYEVWEEPDESGRMLPGLVLAGPDGDAFRRLLEPGARLRARFKAGSHFEAMTTYYRLVGYAAYHNDEPWSHEAHSQQAADCQASGAGQIKGSHAMTEHIAAERTWYGIGPDGTGHKIIIRVGMPSLQAGGGWLAPVSLIGLEARVHPIVGVDSWQAVNLAMSFAAVRAGHFAEDGWQFFWERGGESANPADLVARSVAP